MSSDSTEVAVTKPTPPAIQLGNRGVELQTFDEMWRFAVAVSQSGMAPKGMGNAETIMVAMQMGAEVGLPPMASIQNIAVINGRPSLWGDAMLGVCMASGLFDVEIFTETLTGQGDAMVATCIVRRLPNGQPVTSTFSMADAKTAGLKGKQGPWTNYPKRMLKFRARSWALRDTFADLLRGIGSAEENRDIVNVVSAEPSAPATSLDELTTELSASTPALPAEKVEPAEEQPDPPEIVSAEAMKEATDAFAHCQMVKECLVIQKQFRAKGLPKYTMAAIDRLCAKRHAEIADSRGQGSNKKAPPESEPELPPKDKEPEEIDFAESDMLRIELCQRLIDGEPVPVVEAEATVALGAKQLTQADCEAVLQACVNRAAGMSPEQ